MGKDISILPLNPSLAMGSQSFIFNQHIYVGNYMHFYFLAELCVIYVLNFCVSIAYPSAWDIVGVL